MMSSFLTKNIFIPISHFRRSLRSDMRPVFEAYQEGLKFRRDSLGWSDEQKNVWILERLRFSLRRAARETTYYEELFQKIGFDAESDFSFEDFAKLPILEKEDVQNAGGELVTNNISREKLKKDATGGSTGTPTQIWLGCEEMGWKESGSDFAFELFDIPKGAKTAYFWGHHLDPQASESLKDRLQTFMTNIRWFDCFRLSPEIFQKYHEEFEKWSPDVIVAYAGALGHFAEYLKENDIKPQNYPNKCFVTGAEKLFPEHRKTIEEVFNKPVHERYGGRDFGQLGYQIEPNKNLEFTMDWAWALVEPETNEGNSSILITKLHADGMPMIRYRVGDVGKFPKNSKSGHPAFKLKEVIGRDLDRIWLPDGKFIHAIQLPHLMKDFPVKEFMIIQEENYDVEIQVVPKNGFDSKDETKILQTVRANLADLNINLKKVEKIPRTKANKWRPVLSKVKKMENGKWKMENL